MKVKPVPISVHGLKSRFESYCPIGKSDQVIDPMVESIPPVRAPVRALVICRSLLEPQYLVALFPCRNMQKGEGGDAVTKEKA